MAINREKLRKLHAMLGDNAGERENAVAAIKAMLAADGKTWNHLAELLQAGNDGAHWWDVGGTAPPPPPPPPPPGETQNVLDALVSTIAKFLYLEEHETIAVALWILHTFVFRQSMFTPRLAILAPVRGCGKSTVLDVLERLTLKPQKFDHSSAAGLYHCLDEQPTLLLDEVDNLALGEQAAIRAVLNSGHKVGGYKGIVGKKFATFAPAAFAAIGTLPLPLLQRSIVIHMQRAPRDAELRRFDVKDDAQMTELLAVYSIAWHWARDVKLDLDPPMPRELHNRRADNWRVLLAIAEACNRGALARAAALALSRDHRDEDPAVELLIDMRVIFDQLAVDRLPSARLVAELHGLEDAAWSEWRGTRSDQQPHKLSQAELSQLLRPFGIKPKSVWPLGPRTDLKSKKGYFRDQFEAAWASYCSDGEDGTPAQASNIRHLGRAG